MKECVWLRPEAVAQIEFLEWTAGDRLRHSKFVWLREDKDPRTVIKEAAEERSKMPGQITLAVHMEEEGRRELYSRGFKSSDQMAGPISTALRNAGLHYSPIFVSIAVYHSTENPHDENAPAYRAFGPPVILHQSVLSEITIACWMDFQNAVSNRHNFREVFRDLRNKPPGEIEQQLLGLLRKRPSTSWTEARIYRLLTPDDVLDDRYKSLVPHL